jgi:glutamate formiminotransferase
MTGPLVECVPNFSEGRDRQKVDSIADSIASVQGISVLDVTLDPDHNRSVITFAGPPEGAGEAAIRAVARAVESIDLNSQAGVHPRIGAADVVPFVPVQSISLPACAGIATVVGEQIWRRLGVPVYLYEAAARRKERVNLEDIRRGGFEGLRELVRTDPRRLPDFGESELHPTAGATAVGARKFLIAFNINLQTPDVDLARNIAREIRTSSGGLPCVKAMGIRLESRNLAQVSMNLTDFERTPVDQVFAQVRDRAASQGVAITGCEIIGLIPRKALEGSEEWLPLVEGFRPELILEHRLGLE